MNSMQHWNAYRDALKERVGDFAKLSPDVIRGFRTVESSAATLHADSHSSEGRGTRSNRVGRAIPSSLKLKLRVESIRPLN
jgi:hypothetical protein